MKCPVCDGKGYFPISDIAAKICDRCNGTGEIQQTEQEYIQTCDTEQLAKWITDKINAKLRMALHDAELYDGDVNENEYMENEDEWVEWLKQPHREENEK